MGQERYVPALRFRCLTRAYDPVVRFTTREHKFKGRLLTQLDPRAGERILDLGCGTGTLSIQIKQAQAGCDVVGLDGDPEVLSRARAKAKEAGAEVSFDLGFSTDLPYADGEFDAVVSSLFFHHLDSASKVSTAEEIARVLHPDGELHVADWGRAHNPLGRAVFLLVRALDGFENTCENAAGGLPSIFASNGLDRVTEVDRITTPLGAMVLLNGIRPAAERQGKPSAQ